MTLDELLDKYGSLQFSAGTYFEHDSQKRMEFHAQARAIRELLAARLSSPSSGHRAGEGEADTKRLDWLSDNLAYIMLGANLTKGRSTMRTLENNGRGWADGELRAALDRAMEKEP